MGRLPHTVVDLAMKQKRKTKFITTIRPQRNRIIVSDLFGSVLLRLSAVASRSTIATHASNKCQHRTTNGFAAAPTKAVDFGFRTANDTPSPLEEQSKLR